jgi:hypothetical protein
MASTDHLFDLIGGILEQAPGNRRGRWTSRERNGINPALAGSSVRRDNRFADAGCRKLQTRRAVRCARR